MADDQKKRKEGPVDPVVTPVQWGSILCKVKDQIPTMDPDIMYGGDEEGADNFIFQRDESYLIPDLTEELEDLPVDEAELQKRYAFMRHPRETRNEDQARPSPQKSFPPVLQDQDGLLAGEKSSQQGKFPSESHLAGKKAQDGISGVPLGIEKYKERAPPPVEVPPLASVEERRQFIESNILSKAALRPPPKDAGLPRQKNNNNNAEKAEEPEEEPGSVLAECPQGLTVLDFKDLEKWDLDKVLQDLKYQSGNSCWSPEMTPPLVNEETSSSRSQTRLMEKLEELSLKQSGAFLSERRKDSAQTHQPRKSQGDRNGASILAPGRTLTPMGLPSSPEPPTVYVDLREEISHKPEPSTDATQSSSDGSDDDEEDPGVAGVEEVNGEAKALSWDRTAKSFLLKQLRDFRKNTTQPSPAVPGNERPQNLKRPEETDLRGVREGALVSMDLPDPGSDPESFSLGCCNDAPRQPREIGGETWPCSELPTGSA